MAHPRKIEVTDAELAILQALWERPHQAIASLVPSLYSRGGKGEYATVQTLLMRLEKKGCVVRDRSQRAHVFAAAVQREDLIASHLTTLAEKLCGGSFGPLVSHLVRGGALKEEDRQAIREALSELEDDTP